MTQLDNIISARPLVKFPSRCGSASINREPKYHSNNQEVPNTYLSALGWISRHDGMLRKFVHLIQQFPNLINDPELRYFSLFLNEHYQSRIKEQQEKAVERILCSPHARRVPSSYSLLSPAKIEVYISGEICETQWTNTDFITRELAQHFKVQSDPPLPRFPGFQAEEDLVVSSNVMIFILSDKSLGDPFCVHQLRTAIASHVPVILIREAEGVEVPSDLYNNDIPIFYNRPVTALADIADKSPVLFLDDSTKPPGRDENRGVNKSVDKINEIKESVPQKTVYLMDWLKKEISRSLVFTFEHRAGCMKKIINRVKTLALGEVLVDGFGDNIPTDLPTSPDDLETVGLSFHNTKVADMAESLMACPTSSLWGGVPSCGRCRQHVPLPDRLSTPATPHPNDPTLSKFLHFSQRSLQSKTQSKCVPDRPATAPCSLSRERRRTKIEDNTIQNEPVNIALAAEDKHSTDSRQTDSRQTDNIQTDNIQTYSIQTVSSEKLDMGKKATIPIEAMATAELRRAESRGSRPTSARSVTFSETDQVKEFKH